MILEWQAVELKEKVDVVTSADPQLPVEEPQPGFYIFLYKDVKKDSKIHVFELVMTHRQL